MEKLLHEIKNNLATLRCRLKEQGISAKDIQIDSWDNSLGFKVGIWNDNRWLRKNQGDDYQQSIAEFCELIERKKILFRKFGGVQ